MNSATCRLSSPKHMRPWMAEDLIVTMYKQALHPRSQIDVLAQLNDVPRAVIEEILQRHGCDIGAKRRLVRTDAAKQPWSQEEDDFIRHGYNSNMDQKSMADELGRTLFAVKARLHTLGINAGRRKTHEGKNKTRELAAGEEG